MHKDRYATRKHIDIRIILLVVLHIIFIVLFINTIGYTYLMHINSDKDTSILITSYENEVQAKDYFNSNVNMYNISDDNIKRIHKGFAIDIEMFDIRREANYGIICIRIKNKVLQTTYYKDKSKAVDKILKVCGIQ